MNSNNNIRFAESSCDMPNEKREKIGNILREARELCGMSQLELADMVGYSKNTINRIEAGKVDPGMDQLIRLCEVLNIEISVNGIKI